MKNAALIEMLICGTVGLYCVTRMYVLLPAAMQQAREIVQMAVRRQERYEELLETELE